MRTIIKLSENDLEVATEGGTFVSAAGNTFEIVMGGTFKNATISFEIHFSSN